MVIGGKVQSMSSTSTTYKMGEYRECHSQHSTIQPEQAHFASNTSNSELPICLTHRLTQAGKMQTTKKVYHVHFPQINAPLTEESRHAYEIKGQTIGVDPDIFNRHSLRVKS